jgi:alkanesulfonate monooxygenase SsuD/methylene tetrahydromethanopterin reductase-like flavin-dependent oxidoreductase (luciferase family)
MASIRELGEVFWSFAAVPCLLAEPASKEDRIMPLEFGLDFFPDMRPHEKSPQQYFDEALHIAEACDSLGSSRVKIVEHYFHSYGGCSPNPCVYLAAAAMRTTHQRVMTGAVLPAFNHPLKLAGELGMLDCLSHGRLDAGIARAFLPHEFEAFGVPMAESRSRFEEGIDALRALWTQDDVTFHGEFHQFEHVTSLPRPVQKPHPPIWIAAVATPASYQWAGEQAYYLMVVPYLANHQELAENIKVYRDAYRQSGAPGEPRVMMVQHCVLDHDRRRAHNLAWMGMEHYLGVFRDIAAQWAGRSEAQYAAYSELPHLLAAMTRERIERERRALVGDPAEVLESTLYLLETFGEVELSFNVHFGGIGVAEAIKSIALFAQDVNPFVKAPFPQNEDTDLMWLAPTY